MNFKKILITGSSGLLGAHLMMALSRAHEVMGIDRHPWWGDQPLPMHVGDLTDATLLGEVIGAAEPDVLLHCAALVNVDACERDAAQAYALNAQLTSVLARAVPRTCLVVYVSTDGIFQGDRPNATEEDLPCPRTVYARSKLHGEWEVQQATENHLIVRTNFYGWSSGRKETAAEWLYHALEAERAITLFDDFFFSPIYVVDFVERLTWLIEGGSRGLVHLSGRERISKYQFGALMARAAGFSMAKVRRGSIDDAHLSARRPKDMSLDCRRFATLTGKDLPGCLEGLQRFLEDRSRRLSARVGTRQDSSVAV